MDRHWFFIISVLLFSMSAIFPEMLIRGETPPRSVVPKPHDPKPYDSKPYDSKLFDSDIHQYGNLNHRFSSRSSRETVPNWGEYFETDRPGWAVIHWEQGASVMRQGRSPDHAFQGEKSEFVQLALPRNSCLLLGHSVDFPIVIDDTQPTVCIRSDLPNIVLGAQIVLPYSIHPETKRPLTFLIQGSRYGGSGQWERLGFWDKDGRPNLSREVQRIASLLRYDLKMNVDLRDRYIRQIVLFCESDSVKSHHELRIDALEISGHVRSKNEILARSEKEIRVFDPVNYGAFKLQAGSQCVFHQSYSSESLVGYTDWNTPAAQNKASPLLAASSVAARENRIAGQRSLFDEDDEVRVSLTNSRNATEPPFSSPASLMSIQLQDRVLTLNDTPVGVRCIEYQGEPLALLRQLEFNTVWIKHRPSPELLREAADAGVWLVSPPPEPSEFQSATTYDTGRRDRFQGTPQIDPIYDNVLVWNFGDECTNPGHQVIAQQAALLQNADRARRRPILCTARSGVREYSRIVNLLMMDRKPIFSSLDFFEWEHWLSAYPMLARPDTPFWCTIQTDADARLANQWTLFGGNVQNICAMTHEQLKMQVYRAVAVGTHGLIFTSNSPLNANDPATEYRRTSLELMNWELQMLEKWFAEGRSRSTLVKSSLNGKMVGAVLQAGRTRLLLPIWRERDSQFALGGAVEGPLHYVVSGVPETYDAYQLTPGRLLPLNAEYVAGGMKVELEEANLNTLVYFGEFDKVYAEISETATKIGPRAAYLACRLAELQLASTEKVFSDLKRAKEAGAMPEHLKDSLPLVNITEQESLVKETKDWIDRAKLLIEQNPPDYSKAYLQAEKSTRGLRATARGMFRNAIRHDLNPCMTPVSVSFATLPLYLSAYQRMSGATLEPTNRLPGGDMESKMDWNRSGWKPELHKIDGVAPPILEISPLASRPKSGKFGLRLRVQPIGEKEKPVQLETAPLYFVSPPVPVRMGELICFSGWVRIPRPLESTVDGLMIFDSLGGEPLALRFLQTKGQWKEFAFYRYVPGDCNYYLCCLLHGFGEVHLDDLRVSAVRFEMPKPVDPTPPPAAPSPWQRFNPLQYFPPLPNWGQRQ